MKFRHWRPTHLSPSSAPYRYLRLTDVKVIFISRVGVNSPPSFSEKSKSPPPHARADCDYGLPHQAPHRLIVTKVLGCSLIEVIMRSNRLMLDNLAGKRFQNDEKLRKSFEDHHSSGLVI
uniref:Uncharacterized protein LOC104246828 isoform X1 n=1 Tax=Nicotiana sylvestris TaxID=4096 RepID=A0A1U7YQ97_NICSY|nr:PREDICTED: uncharacterized protein LOC104246828 isoform X1 [Nicotiana sylvestris]